jgi:hypothetical protein
LLREKVRTLDLQLAELEKQRSTDSFANDVYEAVWYCRDLSNWVLENNAKVNFPARAREELRFLRDLRKTLTKKSSEEQERYAPVFETAEEVLNVVETRQPPKDGYLGILRVIRERFGFLQTDYGFVISKEEPIGAQLSSGHVYIQLEWARNYHSSCSFGPEFEPEQSFSIDDLLFMYHDQRYLALPEELLLITESDVDHWFAFVADIFKQYGLDMLCSRPGIFDTLSKAQAQRNQQYIEKMKRRSEREGK